MEQPEGLSSYRFLPGLYEEVLGGERWPLRQRMPAGRRFQQRFPSYRVTRCTHECPDDTRAKTNQQTRWIKSLDRVAKQGAARGTTLRSSRARARRQARVDKNALPPCLHSQHARTQTHDAPVFTGVNAVDGRTRQQTCQSVHASRCADASLERDTRAQKKTHATQMKLTRGSEYYTFE